MTDDPGQSSHPRPATPGSDSSPGHSVARRGAIALGAALAAVTTSGTAHRRPPAHVDLLSLTVALRGPGERVLVRRSGPTVPPDTRVLPDAHAHEELRAEENRVLEALAARSSAPNPLLTDAVRDLHVLSTGLPAPVAGWSSNWRYVWPRDAAHAAVALHQLGLRERAWATVHELAVLCGSDGWFEARYVPGRRHAPDGRPRQLDGTGWFLWALDSVLADDDTTAVRETNAASALASDGTVQSAARRAAALLLELTANDDRLPPPSPDYWEVRERRLTIATAALVAVGLERAGRLPALIGEEMAAHAHERAVEVRAAIRDAFGPSGFTRYAGGTTADAGMLFLLPPYALHADDEVADLLRPAEQRMRRPAGGVAPGEGWKRDGISWTPQTALFAQAYAQLGLREEAQRLWDWLAVHCTSAGSLPEKVLADGSPAAVAPLTWTASVVIMGQLGV
ncbi:hypothetical protein [Brachybacterium timonense]|uniref:hypothetical protein n=1 Tax=Brachybacterium timonense TaxID=2050896 RepID=UPI000D0BBFB0|nr:hypothetical protein [Brachybacterium timonense]